MVPDENVEDIEIRLVLEAIHARYGYDLRDYAAGSMRRRLHAALTRLGVAHLGELQHRLLEDPEFFARVVDDLLVRVSDMFRDPPFYRSFREKVVPVLRTYPKLKIWHAGCASGEEVYTTAIVLAEAELYERSLIYATDMSAAALALAREGVYSEAQAAGFAQNYRDSGGCGRFEDYCTRAYGKLAVREGLRKNVFFFQHNLASDYALGEMHVIVCRNVLIYFGARLQERVLDMFSHSIYSGGFLCLGKSERVLPSRAAAFREFVGSDRIYRHRGEW
jgi:chemotaxis protein methyltransferase CheR